MSNSQRVAILGSKNTCREPDLVIGHWDLVIASKASREYLTWWFATLCVG
jgi:hypothetical protein